MIVVGDITCKLYFHDNFQGSDVKLSLQGNLELQFLNVDGLNFQQLPIASSSAFKVGSPPRQPLSWWKLSLCTEVVQC